jgi:hypothetical protein
LIGNDQPHILTAMPGCQDTGGINAAQPSEKGAIFALAGPFPLCATIELPLIACVTFSARTE